MNFDCFVPQGELTLGEQTEIKRYKAWMEDPRYLAVVPLAGNYAVAVMKDKKIELRRRDTVVQGSGTIFKWVATRTCKINDDDTIENWDFIAIWSSMERNEAFNLELQQGCISAYRKIHREDKNDD